MVRIKPSVKPPMHLKSLPWKGIVIGIAMLLGGDLVTYFWAEGLWFDAVGYLPDFWLRLQTQIGLGAVAVLGSFGFAIANLLKAQRLSFDDYCLLPSDENRRSGIGLGLLLPLACGLALTLALLLFYQSQLAISRWHSAAVTAPLPPLPLWLNVQTCGQLLQQIVAQRWPIGVVVSGMIALLIYPRILGMIGALIMSLSFGLVLSEQWSRVLPVLNPTPFNQSDPLFQKDISFYIFQLPVLELLEFWASGLLLFTLATVTLIYLLAGNSLSQGRFIEFSTQQQRHLYGLAGGLLLTTSFSHWLNRYELLYSTQGVNYGASFTDINVNLPVDAGLSLTTLILAIVLLWRTRFWHLAIPKRLQGSRILLAVIAIYLGLAALGLTLVPELVQRLIVLPNELERETPFIDRTIAFTRAAFNLTNIQDEVFIPQNNLTAAVLAENDLTIRNIRLWDTRPLLETNRQLQQIRSYYEFVDADLDRYNLKTEDGNTERRQVLISARELNIDRLDPSAQTWVNQHLSYTHGYGFTMSPVNTARVGGLPDYFIQDIAHLPSSPAIADSIPLEEPRIYFGELTNNYIMTSTRVQEFDYPSGSDNVYTTYQGNGGLKIGSFWRRLLFAKHLGDWEMLFTNNFTPQTQLLFHRNIQDRIHRIAPFLKFDQDPYLVIADAEFQTDELNGMNSSQAANRPPKNYLYWIVDAYTTSDRYPYADPGEQAFNYIRNSVKVVVDAYHGTVNFYASDPSDPLIKTWSRLFPNLLQPLSAMPKSLIDHIRYPEDLFSVQSNQLLIYHMTDPRVFYNREDQWRAPNEIYANEAQLVDPYYLILKLPQENEEEFVLLRPFTPAQRNNLIAWLAARSDDQNYGRILLYRFPKQELVYGPEQIEARINQDPEISQQISLWNTEGSRANQGNLLVIPIEESLLYVEPLYLEAKQNQLPILARVIVAYQNRIAMSETLEQSLEAIFNPQPFSKPTILRNLDANTGTAETLIDPTPERESNLEEIDPGRSE